MLYDMGGADDKVKIIGSCVVGNFFCTMTNAAV